MKILKYLVLLLSIIVMGASIAQNTSDQGDDQFSPSVGQDGKDVIWVPTGNELIIKMLQTAQVSPKDLVYDLGAGDGKIAISAAKDFGARAVGIEYNESMAALGQRNAVRAGVADKVKIIQGDIFKEDFSKASVVTLYLLPELNLKLRPTILKMKPGTRVVSHAFTMGDWEADIEIDKPGKAYYWKVPANVVGEWTLDYSAPQTKTTLSLVQHFQRIGGMLTIGRNTQPIINPKLDGNKLQFGYLDAKNNYHTVRATVTDSTIKGEDRGDTIYNEFSGKRN
ncbi:class I SAM-dependent methyltransferase [Polynucleobacter antarcticus]|uniref:Class I SAM-dependent methyltransferase n=1 Tax=Polynucleobacter antarcticus TaxID=1743162 RepID=A0A6M9PU39_9BURK|nr:class I SAM-dependent methyltransferase [Polynucleobacter antarcticus]QKM62387.1 class I SAM-dependent methyltransferase [Polynucleobacter antarcticus]